MGRDKKKWEERNCILLVKMLEVDAFVFCFLLIYDKKKNPIMKKKSFVLYKKWS